jgi:hypothetical protein
MSGCEPLTVRFCAVTFTTGVRPRRPRVRPFGGLRPWPDSSSKQSQAPRSAAVLLSPASVYWNPNRSRASQRPAPPVRRHPRHAQPFRDLPATGPGLDQLRGSQLGRPAVSLGLSVTLNPNLLATGPFRGGQPAAIGIPQARA